MGHAFLGNMGTLNATVEKLLRSAGKLFRRILFVNSQALLRHPGMST
jgi:hypothetical protein